MLKVVIDTNVLVSGTLVNQGPSARILRAIQLGQIVLITSRALLEEYEAVIRRPHIANKYSSVREESENLVTFLSVKAELVEYDLKQQGLIPTDPKDDIVIATALAGKADYIVSGDRHLTAFRDFGGIPILTPAAFVKQARL